MFTCCCWCDSGDNERDSSDATKLQWRRGGNYQRLLKCVAHAPRSNRDLTVDLSLQLIQVQRHGPIDEKTWLFMRV